MGQSAPPGFCTPSARARAVVFPDLATVLLPRVPEAKREVVTAVVDAIRSASRGGVELSEVKVGSLTLGEVAKMEPKAARAAVKQMSSKDLRGVRSCACGTPPRARVVVVPDLANVLLPRVPTRKSEVVTAVVDAIRSGAHGSRQEGAPAEVAAAPVAAAESGAQWRVRVDSRIARSVHVAPRRRRLG